MYQDVTDWTNKIHEDDLSKFLSSVNISVSTYGVWKQEAKTSVKNYIFTDYEIVYVTKGEFSITTEGQTHTAKVGDAILLEPFTLYTMDSTSIDDLEYTYIHFDFERYIYKQRFIDIIKGSGSLIFSSTEVDGLAQMYDDVFRTSNESQIGHYLLVQVMLLRVLITFARIRNTENSIKEVSDKVKIDTFTIRTAVEFVQENLSTRINVKEIAAAVGVSENKLYRDFMDTFKISPSKYFMQLKINRAKILLQTTNKSIQEISEELGFSSSFHFSKAFKSVLSTNPSQIRRPNR